MGTESLDMGYIVREGDSMKIPKYISTLIIILALVFASFTASNISKREIILARLENDYRALQGQMTKISNSSRGQTESLADKIEQLTQENMRLKQENADLKNQIKQFGWWKD